MKHTFIAFIIILSLILTPLQGIHAATTQDNTALIQKLLEQIVILQAELQKLIVARGGNTTTTATTTPCTFTRTLYLGTQGQDVTCLQTYLKKKGHFNGTATGYYGPLTRDAVYKWQQSTGIIPEPKAIGMFGPRSQETLIREMRTQAPAVTTNTTPNTTNTTPRSTGGGGGGGGRKVEAKTEVVFTPSILRSTVSPVSNSNNMPSVASVIPKQTVSATNWKTLCEQSGIFVCDNFSDRKTGTIYPGFSTPYFKDGNLVFTIPSNSSANAGGEYRHNFPAVSEGEFIAFSYRIKADQNTFVPQIESRKEYIMWRGSSSCTDLQLVQVHYYASPLVVPYSNCGDKHFSYQLPDGDFQLQYPDFDCRYRTLSQQGDYSKCAVSHPNQWENYYVEIQIGNFNKENSRVTMWYKPDGGSWKRYIDTSTFSFFGEPGEGFEHFMLTVYMTGKDTSIAHPEGKVYYDHLIMSTKPFNTDQFIAATVNPVTAAPAAPISNPASGSSVTLVDFGGSVSENIFGLVGWDMPFKDVYTEYQNIGPGGTVNTGTNPWYNYQGVKGVTRSFNIGDKVDVTWYNNSNSAITFTPNISFENSGRYTGNSGNTWYPMTRVTVPPNSTAINEYVVTAATAGLHSLVNINTNYAGTAARVAVADKIVLTIGNNAGNLSPATSTTPTTSNTPSPVLSTPQTTTSNPSPSTGATPGVSALQKPVPAVSKTTAPSFVSQASSIASGSWGSISADNSAIDIDPAKDSATKGFYDGTTGYRSVWEAWNSGAYAPALGKCGSLLYFGGGHADYYGNEVIALDLCGGQGSGPIWRRLSDPYIGTISWPLTSGAFPNNTPSPPHTYDGLAFDESGNVLTLINAQTMNTTATVSKNAWLFNVVSGQWSGPYEHKGSMEGVVTFDSKRKLVWFQPTQGKSGELTSFNTKTGAMTYYGWPYTYGLGELDSMMGYDPVQDKLILTSLRSGKMVAERDLNNPSAGWKIAVQKNIPSATHGQHAFAWSNLRQAWIVWDSYAGAAVYELKKTGTNASGVSEYTWTLLTSASNTVQPVGASTNGSYKKFQIVQTAPGTEVLVGQLQLSAGIKAFRIPTPTQVPTAIVATKPTTVPLTSSQTKVDLLQDLLIQLRVLQAELKKLKN